MISWIDFANGAWAAAGIAASGPTRAKASMAAHGRGPPRRGAARTIDVAFGCSMRRRELLLSAAGRDLDPHAVGASGQDAVLILAHLRKRVEQPVAAPDQQADDHEGDDVRPHAAAIFLAIVRAAGVLTDVPDGGGRERRRWPLAPPLRARLEAQHLAGFLWRGGRVVRVCPTSCLPSARLPPARSITTVF